jgi:cytochrome o ubiquinol oxidase operon protein cyoD
MSELRLARADLLTYGIGYVLAIALTSVAFALVYFHVASPGAAFAAVLLLGLVQIMVHMRCFLHMSLERSARSDLMLVLFSVLIIAVMVSGTLIVLFNLRMRMM